MPRPKLTLTLQKDVLTQHLERTYNGFQKLIQGAKKLSVELRIDGHDYWWFLEFGTASQVNKARIGDIQLTPPPLVRGQSFKGRKTYPIERHRAYLQMKIFPKEGKPYLRTLSRRRRFLRFMGTKGAGKRAGKLILVPRVMHPGTRPRMRLRIEISQFRSGLEQELYQLPNMIGRFPDADGRPTQTLPQADYFKSVFQRHGTALQKRIERTTPVSRQSYYYWGRYFDKRWQWRSRSRGATTHLVTDISVKVNG